MSCRNVRVYAQLTSAGHVPRAELGELPGKEVIGQLTMVKGIGAWTVQGTLPPPRPG